MITLALAIVMAAIGAVEFELRHYALATLDGFCVLFLLVALLMGGMR